MADGLASNGPIPHGSFADFEPSVEVVHVACYLYRTASGPGGEEAARWSRSEGWVRPCWPGRVAEVVAALRGHQPPVGRPPPGPAVSASAVRRRVAASVSYLGNNATRMGYPRERRLGLPTTSGLVESRVGAFNARVKSEPNYRDRPDGAAARRHVRAAYLGAEGCWPRDFAPRPGNPSRRKVAGPTDSFPNVFMASLAIRVFARALGPTVEPGSQDLWLTRSGIRLIPQCLLAGRPGCGILDSRIGSDGCILRR